MNGDNIKLEVTYQRTVVCIGGDFPGSTECLAYLLYHSGYRGRVWAGFVTTLKLEATHQRKS